MTGRGPGARGGRHASGDATSELLDQVMYRPVTVDPGRDRRGPLSLVGARLVVGVVLGLSTVAAVSTLRAPAPEAVSARALLVDQIRDRASHVEELSATIQALDGQISTLRSELLGAEDPGLLAGLRQVELLSGAIPVAGPGLVVELDDPDVADPAELSAEARVQDVDVQIVVNGLRAAGAEAVAVNGQRLTATSAIRGAGQAILVDLAPLVGPYRVEAIGDVSVMRSGFARSYAADHLASIAGAYGIRTSVRTEEHLRLPGAARASLRHAVVPEDVASSVRRIEEGAP